MVGGYPSVLLVAVRQVELPAVGHGGALHRHVARGVGAGVARGANFGTEQVMETACAADV